MFYDKCNNRVRRTPATITADDGRELAGNWFEPLAAPAVGTVVIAPAIATPAAYYAGFATWLADRGHQVLTFDLRGTESVMAMRSERGDVLRWFADMRDALGHALARTNGLPVTWVGHSLGGQALAFVDHERLDRVLTIASGTGYWRLNAPAVRWRAPLFWRGIAPVTTRLAGYYPGRRLRLLGDLPAAVMRQWGRWCMHRDYLGIDVPDAAERFARVRTPISVISFSDDELISRASITDLHDRYVHADQIRHRYTPAQLDVLSMGHHGFFKTRHHELWDELVLPYLAA